ncbi:MAG: ABC transporter permease [Ilumatobacter sp.]|uniref:ABC transporter permease n=1 Tax=Ilumatobacter sp. TaxID=1967498 RepID=UPI002638C803|nr:ABC transporter permease [Ilumatobacter sp.]MDJ0767324.1 ABC transporter permease [Ilumatobacter sp.]
MVYVAIRLGTNPSEAYQRSNPRANAAKIREYEELNNLTGNYFQGYWGWFSGFLEGLTNGGESWQRSIKGRREVWPELRDAMANSLRLGAAASFVGITIGLSLGVFAALRPGSLRDATVNTGAFVAFSIPPYVSAVLLQLLFAVMWSKWFGETLLPTSGVYPAGQQGFDLWLMLKHMILPVSVVAIQIIAVYARYMRASLLEVLNSDYMRTARSKGISERRVLVSHAVRNSMIPVVTVAAIDIGGILGGLIITERVFSYPGMGDFFLTAFDNGDFPQLMPFMVIIVTAVIMFNLLADVSYAWLDPRIRLD